MENTSNTLYCTKCPLTLTGTPNINTAKLSICCQMRIAYRLRMMFVPRGTCKMSKIQICVIFELYKINQMTYLLYFTQFDRYFQYT